MMRVLGRRTAGFFLGQYLFIIGWHSRARIVRLWGRFMQNVLAARRRSLHFGSHFEVHTRGDASEQASPSLAITQRV